YQFQNTLASALPMGPGLANLGANTFVNSVVDGQSRTVLRFAENDGVALSSASSIIPNDIYTVVVLFSFSNTTSWRRIIDFKNATTESGLYVLSGALDFYPVAGGPTAPILSNTFVQVALTRDSSKNVIAYANAVQQFSFIDSADQAAIDDT